MYKNTVPSAAARSLAEQEHDRLERIAAKQRELDAFKRSNERTRREYLAGLEAKREAERQASAEAAEARLRATVRARFFANASATEEDFARLWPQLRDEALLERARTAGEGARQYLMNQRTYGM